MISSASTVLAAPRARMQGQLLIQLAAFIIALTFVSRSFADSPRSSPDLTLAPNDRITVTVYGQSELSGEMVVDGAGNVVLPLVGAIYVKGLTIAECQKLIQERLADGILKQPLVSVRVSELRPIYILGDVRLPGAYPFRYGSTVQSAVAGAGGFGVAEPAQSIAVSEFLLADERVRQLRLQQRTLLVREARLKAQSEDRSTFSEPIMVDAGDLPHLVAIEKDALASQTLILKTQLDLLSSQKPRIQTEIDSLNAQIATTKKELELVSRHASQYGQLVKQGLGLANAELQLKLVETSRESELWRLTAQVSRLQMDAGDLDLKIHEAEATFKRQIATDLLDVRGRLTELAVTLPSAEHIRQIKLQQAGSLAGGGATRGIAITRVRDGEVRVVPATEITPLEPGDTIDVRRLLPPELQGPTDSGRPSSLHQDRMGAADASPAGPVVH